ncbi:hypothetical protein GJ496_006169 [Pomphorhynchus laevis]|nr:hypothetical protein GJ496_006169 [Pomphorhynchus laevis]
MTRGKPSNTTRCCDCNGFAAACKRCRCAKDSKHCVDRQAPNCRNQTTSCDKNEAEIIPTTVTASYPTINSASNLTVNTARNTVSTLNSNFSQLDELSVRINAIYYEVIHGRPNLFNLHKCNLTKTFIELMTSHLVIFNNMAKANISFKIMMILPQLILQRISSGKVSVLRKILERRIRMWKYGDIKTLLIKARFLQQNTALANDGHR